jgi:hypothetical protein
MTLRSPYDYSSRPAHEIIELLQPLSMRQLEDTGPIPVRLLEVGIGAPPRYAPILAPMTSPSQIDCDWCPMPARGPLRVQLKPTWGKIHGVRGVRILAKGDRAGEVTMRALHGDRDLTAAHKLASVGSWWDDGPLDVDWGTSQLHGPSVVMEFHAPDSAKPNQYDTLLYFVVVGVTADLPEVHPSI